MSTHCEKDDCHCCECGDLTCLTMPWAIMVLTPMPALPAPSTTMRCCVRLCAGLPWTFSAPYTPARAVAAVPCSAMQYIGGWAKVGIKASNVKGDCWIWHPLSLSFSSHPVALVPCYTLLCNAMCLSTVGAKPGSVQSQRIQQHTYDCEAITTASTL